jgi:hypothetical protein
MATIRQQIVVAADPAIVRSAWERFVRWAHTGPGRLACDEVACVDAVRSGLVEFLPAQPGRTTVVFRAEETEGGPGRVELRRQIGHDLVVFKDYIERSGLAGRSRSDTERAAVAVVSGRKGEKPRHTRLSSEDDTTFWRSHFPT